jgi:hypothetical protein
VVARGVAQHVEKGHAQDFTVAPTIGPMQALTRRQLLVLVVLTLVWGINWPIMKLGVTGYPP